MIAELNAESPSKLNTLGHTAMDIGGLIPGYGEPIDLANALWYADEGRYFESVLSLLSVVPVVGDAIGKGMKYLGKSGKIPAKFMAKYGDDIAAHWPAIRTKLSQMENWRKHAVKLDDMVQKIKTENVKDTGKIPDQAEVTA